jgi:hypothetical protein
MSLDPEKTFCRKFIALKMKVRRSIEMSAANCPETQLHIPEEPNTILEPDKFLLFTVPSIYGYYFY